MYPSQQLRRLARIRNGSDHSQVQDDLGDFPVYGSGGEFTRASRPLYSGPSVLLGRKGTIDRPLLVDGQFWTVDTMFCAQPHSNVNPTYLYYACTTIPFEMLSTSTALPSMTQGDLNAVRLPAPDTETQRLIAEFLDRETAKIDALIDKQEQLIATLREERQSVVSVALSGYQTIPLHRLVDPARPMSYGILQCGEHIEHGIPYIGPSDMPGRGKSPSLENLRRTSPEIADQYRRSIVQGGDLVVSIGPAYGKVALLEDDLSGSNLTQDTVRVAPVRSSVDPEFLVWALDSYEAESFWDAEITGATFRRLNLGTLGQTPIPLPDLETQRDIRDRLDETTAKVDTLIDKSTDMIDVLREYRSALITNAVTGKIDVREAV